MNLCIFNHHALTPDMGGGTRHYDFAKELIRRGHHVTIVASSFHYATFKEMKTYSNSPYLHETLDGVDFIWIRTRAYRGNGVGRVLNQLDYMLKALHVTPKNTPDIIIGSSVHLLAVFASWRVARRLNVPFVMEVRDIWPQTLIDMGMSRWHPYVLAMGWLERFLYAKAEKIITLLPYAHEHICRLGVPAQNVVWISNGVDVTAYHHLPQKRSEGFMVTYAGTLGQANVLHTLFEAAVLLKEHHDITFQIFGDGPLKLQFEQFINKHRLDNIHLYPAVSKKEIPHILVNSDVLYVGLKDSPLYRFGISLNKIFDYLASGVPIILASNAKNNPVEQAQAGVTIPPEDAPTLKDAIYMLYKMDPSKRKECYGHGRNYVNANYSVQLLTQKLEILLNGLL